MTNPTPHGQVPDSLIDLIDAYAETRHRCGCAAYNAQTAEARQRVTDYIESIGAGGMQSLRAPGVVALADVLRKLDDTLGPGNVATTALSRHFSTGTSVEQAPAAINSGAEIIIDFSQVGTAGPFPVVDGRVSLPDATMLDLARMLRPTYEAEQQAAPKAAPVELSADSLRHQNKLLAETLGACILASGIVRKDIDGFTGPELLHFGEDLRSMLEAAPQQEAQEPVAWLNPWRADKVTTDYDAYGERGIPLYTAPQPAPAPLSEMPYEKRKAIQEGEQIGASDAWFHARHNMLDTLDRRNVFRAGFDRGWNAAIAAQGGTP